MENFKSYYAFRMNEVFSDCLERLEKLNINSTSDADHGGGYSKKVTICSNASGVENIRVTLTLVDKSPLVYKNNIGDNKKLNLKSSSKSDLNKETKDADEVFYVRSNPEYEDRLKYEREQAIREAVWKTERDYRRKWHVLQDKICKKANKYLEKKRMVYDEKMEKLYSDILCDLHKFDTESKLEQQKKAEERKKEREEVMKKCVEITQRNQVQKMSQHERKKRENDLNTVADIQKKFREVYKTLVQKFSSCRNSFARDVLKEYVKDVQLLGNHFQKHVHKCMYESITSENVASAQNLLESLQRCSALMLDAYASIVPQEESSVEKVPNNNGANKVIGGKAPIFKPKIKLHNEKVAATRNDKMVRTFNEQKVIIPTEEISVIPSEEISVISIEDMALAHTEEMAVITAEEIAEIPLPEMAIVPTEVAVTPIEEITVKHVEVIPNVAISNEEVAVIPNVVISNEETAVIPNVAISNEETAVIPNVAISNEEKAAISIKQKVATCNDDLTQNNKIGTKISWIRFAEFKMFNDKVKDYYKQLTSERAFKKFCFDCRKAVNIPVNAIGGKGSYDTKDKLKKLQTLLSGNTLQIGDMRFNAALHPLGVPFCYDLLAKSMVKQGALIASNPESVFALAYVIAGLWAKFPDFGKLILAKFYLKCPYLLPVYPKKTSDMTEEVYLQTLGYDMTSKGIDPQELYLKKTRGIARLYFAVMVTICKNHPFEITNAWNWLADFMNIAPQVDISACLLLECLEVTGSALIACYKYQFFKLIKLLITDYLPILNKVDDGGPYARLKLFLLKTLKKGTIDPPKSFYEVEDIVGEFF